MVKRNRVLRVALVVHGVSPPLRLDVYAAALGLEEVSLRRIFASCGVTDILRFRTSMRPSRWNSLITFETASRVETIMFARSWWVRRTLRTVPDPLVSPKRSARCTSNVARRAETSRFRRLSITASDCLRRSEKEDNSFAANHGL